MDTREPKYPELISNIKLIPIYVAMHLPQRHAKYQMRPSAFSLLTRSKPNNPHTSHHIILIMLALDSHILPILLLNLRFLL
jgi:hypothetical protein